MKIKRKYREKKTKNKKLEEENRQLKNEVKFNQKLLNIPNSEDREYFKKIFN